MTRRTHTSDRLVLVCLLVLGAACTPDSNDAGAVRDSVAQRFREYEAAYEAGDASRLGSFYIDSVWLRGPDASWRSVRGRAAAETLLAEGLAAVTIHDITFAIDDVVPLGGSALASGTWSERLTVVGDSSPFRLAGSYAALWERQPDGVWLIARFLWNVHTPEPAGGENDP